MIGIYLIAMGTIVLVSSVSWEYYVNNIQDSQSLDIELQETSNGEINRSELPAIGSEETEPQEESRIITLGYVISFMLGSIGLFLFLVV